MIASETGVEYTAASEAAVQAFEATIEAYCSFARDIGSRLKATFEADPAMPMAHVLKGYFFQYMAVPWALAKTPETIARARGLMAKASAREQMHVLGLEAWAKGDLRAAVRIYESILLDQPRDLLALKLANFFYFYLGDSKNVRDSVARVLHAWDPSMPFYGYVTSLYAFGLEETGRYARAERIARAALEVNPRDAWAVHTVAHVAEARDRYKEGIAFLGETEPYWNAGNNFRYHLWWHRLLLHLGLGEADAGLELYDRRLWDPQSDDYLDLTNDIATLQRLEILGVDVGDRWQPLADKVETLCGVRYFAFIDAHYLLALAAAGRVERARLMLDEMKAHAASSRTTTGEITARVNAALCEGLLQYRAGHFERAVDCILPLRDEIRLIGGSHAQRDLFDQVLIDAAWKDRRYTLARALLSERAQARPRNAWNRARLSEAIVALGDLAVADRLRGAPA
ncbi:MAG TPA: tetratricopeptide repeat protein [Burkholderiales bacterium]|nr:tetratricopeptide repeat protein [Burkholderiales bacterium]